MRLRLADEIDRLRRAAGAVTAGRLVVRVDRPGPATVATVAFDRAAPLRAAGALRGSSLAVRLTYRDETAASVGESDAFVLAGYAFALLDRAGTELLAYHWHPNSRWGSPSFPHLHVSAALRPAAPDGSRGVLPLDKLHLPTGPVPLAAFARALVEEFGAEPRAADWAARLRPDPAPPG